MVCELLTVKQYSESNGRQSCTYSKYHVCCYRFITGYALNRDGNSVQFKAIVFHQLKTHISSPSKQR